MKQTWLFFLPGILIFFQIDYSRVELQVWHSWKRIAQISSCREHDWLMVSSTAPEDPTLPLCWGHTSPQPMTEHDENTMTNPFLQDVGLFLYVFGLRTPPWLGSIFLRTVLLSVTPTLSLLPYLLPWESWSEVSLYLLLLLSPVNFLHA